MASKFTPELADQIVERLKTNPSIYSAAAAVNITYPTLMRWLEKGEQGDEQYQDFALRCQEARRTMKDEIVQSLFEIATDRLHPQATKAAKELLSCLYPREFSSVRHVVSHRAPEPEVDVSTLSSDELRVFTHTLKKLKGADDRPAKIANVIDVVEAKKKR